MSNRGVSEPQRAACFISHLARLTRLSPTASVRMLLTCHGAWADTCPPKSHSYQPCSAPSIHGERQSRQSCVLGGVAKASPLSTPWLLPGKGPWRFLPPPMLAQSLAATPALGGHGALRGGTNASWSPGVPISIGATAATGETASPSPASLPLTLRAQLVLHLNKTIIKTIRLSQLLNHLIPKSIPWVI